MDGRDTSKRERRGLWRGAGLTTFYMVLVVALLSLLLAEKMGVALPPGLKTLCEVLCVVLVLWEIFSFLPNPFREEPRESPATPAGRGLCGGSCLGSVCCWPPASYSGRSRERNVSLWMAERRS